MKNSDLPAAPISSHELASCLELGADGSKGLTKREMFAMHAIQALATNGGYAWEDMANAAVNIADALLAELERTE